MTSASNGTWAFGWTEIPTFHVATEGLPAYYSFGAFNVYNSYSTSDTGIPQWDDVFGGYGQPSIWKNTSTSTGNGILPGEVSLHPGAYGQVSVVEWTQSVTGVVHVEGSFGKGNWFQGDNSADMSYFIYRRSLGNPGYAETFSAGYWINYPDTQTFSFDMYNIAGVTYGFGVGYHYQDSRVATNVGGDTPLSLIITGTPAPVPEPTTMILFVTGLTGLAAVRRRKKSC